MAFILRINPLRKFGSLALCVAVAMSAASCGGGGGSAGTAAGASTTTPTLSLAVVSPTTATTNLAAYASTSLTVKVLSNGTADTTPVSVSFASPCATSGKASLPASATTTNGEVTVTYTDKGCGASDAITISATGASVITETFVVASPTPASVEFISAVPASESIVIAGAGGNGRVETATLTFEVLDTEGNPLPNQAVNFSLVPANVVTLETVSGLTDSTGKVVATVTSLSTATTFRVVATLPSGQSTMSDTIAVTTGQTSPESLSISVTTFNIEGWNYDNISTNVNVLLADSNGNPVADGTPVVAQTDSGAIGTSSIGGCVTSDGACTMPFRSQNPRYGAGNLAVPAGKRAGLATVTVSTTTANLPTAITGQVGIFLSGSFAQSAIPAVDPTSGNKVIAPSGAIPWYTVKLANCNPGSVAVQLNDVNNNPLPANSTLTVTAVARGVDSTNTPNPAMTIGTPFPATIPNRGPDSLNVADMAVYQGTIHTVTFTPGANCNATGAYPMVSSAMSPDGEIDFQVTTPQTNASIVPVYFWYPQ
jgi:hypothetical protein